MVKSLGRGVFLAGSTGVVMTPAGPAPKVSFPEVIGGSDKFVPWGDDNLKPQNTVQKTSKSTIIAPTIDKAVRFAYAGGIQAGKYQLVNNEEVFVPVRDKNFLDFKRKSGLNRYALEALSDLFWFNNAFPNLILTKDRTKILQLFIEQACYCRWGKPNETTGLVETCYISANWDKGNVDLEKTVKATVVDAYFDPVTQIKETKDYRYVLPVDFPSPNFHHYQQPSWYGAMTSGWLDFTYQIPEFKKAMMENQLALKYHIEVDELYWESNYDDWDKKSPIEQEGVKSEWLTAFTKDLSDTQNANKSIMTQFKVTRDGKEQSVIKITPIDDKIKSGIYVEDSQEASAHLINSLGVDPALFPFHTGKGMSGGSGSDKNSSYNLLMASFKPFHDLVLEPLYVVKEFNGWDEELEFRFTPTFMAESTSGKPRMQKEDSNAKPAN
jgi:hypothetical protein